MNTAAKWLFAGLFVSLAINIFILGYFIGMPLKKSEQATIQAETLAEHQDMQGIFKTIPSENRKLMKEMMDRQKQEILANREEMRKVRLQIAQIIAQDPMDQPRLAQLFDKLLQLSSKNLGLAQKTIYQTIIQLPQSERIKIAKVLVNPPRQKQVPLSKTY